MRTDTSLKIRVGGKEYPAYMTMGALRRYKRLTGREAREAAADEADFDNSVTLLYCLTVAACRAEGVPFDMDEDTFADSLLVEDLTAYFEQFNAAPTEAEGEAEGKKAKPRRR